MRYNGALCFLAARRPSPAGVASDEDLPEIRLGAFAAWAQAARGRGAFGIAAGDVCVTPDGRTGRVVEIVDGGARIVVCQPV
jgi:hypothetical protein